MATACLIRWRRIQSSRATALCFLLLIGGAAGCASAGSPRETWSLPNGQTCYTFLSDTTFVSFSEMVNTAALTQALAALPTLQVTAGDTVLLQVGYDSTGIRAATPVSHGELSDDSAKEIELVLQSYLPEQWLARRPPRPSWSDCAPVRACRSPHAPSSRSARCCPSSPAAFPGPGFPSTSSSNSAPPAPWHPRSCPA
jgi:hypothetical protein